jgi:hypothetical protein
MGGYVGNAPDQTAQNYDERYAPITRPRKNYIINGSWEVNAHGGDQNPIPSASYAGDRWFFFNNLATGVMRYDRIGQDGTFPHRAQSHGRFKVTTADTTIGASERCMVQQRIPMSDLAFGKMGTADAGTLVLSFLHCHTKTGIYSVGIANDDNTRAWVAEYTQDVSDAWETAEIVIPLDQAGTWTIASSLTFKVLFYFAAGSDYHAASNETWSSTTDTVSANQVNGFDSTDNYFRFADVQLEEGEVATEYESLSWAELRSMCEAFFQEVYVYLRDYAGAATRYSSYGVGFRQRTIISPTLTLTGMTEVNCSSSIGSPSPIGCRLQLVSTATGDMYAYGTLNVDAEL